MNLVQSTVPAELHVRLLQALLSLLNTISSIMKLKN